MLRFLAFRLLRPTTLVIPVFCQNLAGAATRLIEELDNMKTLAENFGFVEECTSESSTWQQYAFAARVTRSEIKLFRGWEMHKANPGALVKLGQDVKKEVEAAGQSLYGPLARKVQDLIDVVMQT